jgi:hypothetical protein
MPAVLLPGAIDTVNCNHSDLFDVTKQEFCVRKPAVAAPVAV